MSVELPKDAEGREIPLDFIATGELMIDSIPISFCPFCGRKLKEDE